MSEENMLEAVQEALTHRGIDDQLIAAGQFNPRGHSGGLFVGGIGGSEVGGLAGGVGDAVGLAVGGIGGQHAVDASSGLPGFMLVGVSAENVYGFAGRSRRKEPGELVFQVPRGELEVKVHKRVNVRVLELINHESGSKIELEGNRVPVTHSKDVIEALRG
jgi:hypothetical protein